MHFWNTAAIIVAGLIAWTPAHACGSSKPQTSADILKYQIDVIDRGLRREKLSKDERAKVALLREQVQESQMAGRREDARKAMAEVVSMFKFKEFGGAAEPLVPRCWPTTR